MAEAAKSPIILELEQSLINHLCSKKDIELRVNGGARRVKSLILSINVKNPKNPFFTVQIGICEAAFDIQNGQKIQGSCFGCERYIRDWFERPSVNLTMWNYVIDSKKD